MKRNLIVILILLIVFISAIGIWAIKINQNLDDKNYLMKEIRKEKHLVGHDYKVNRYTKEEVEQFILSLPSKTPSQNINLIRSKMLAQKDIITFFYQSKSMIQYYVSYDRNKNICRLAVQSNNPFLHLGLPGTKNHVVHEIDKEICNGLYGYGKPF